MGSISNFLSVLLNFGLWRWVVSGKIKVWGIDLLYQVSVLSFSFLNRRILYEAFFKNSRLEMGTR